jgi:hypothetical protein
MTTTWKEQPNTTEDLGVGDGSIHRVFHGPWKDRITNWTTTWQTAHPNYSEIYAYRAKHTAIVSGVTGGYYGTSGYSGVGAGYIDVCESVVEYASHTAQNLIVYDKYAESLSASDETITTGVGMVDADDGNTAIAEGEISEAMHQSKQVIVLSAISLTKPLATSYIGCVNSAAVTLPISGDPYDPYELYLQNVERETLKRPDGTTYYRWHEHYLYNENTWFKMWLKKPSGMVLHTVKTKGGSDPYPSAAFTWIH